MTPISLTDDIDDKLERLWQRRKLAHRLDHPDPRDPEFDLENMQSARYDWVPGRTWTQPAPKRGVK